MMDRLEKLDLEAADTPVCGHLFRVMIQYVVRRIALMGESWTSSSPSFKKNRLRTSPPPLPGSNLSLS